MNSLMVAIKSGTLANAPRPASARSAAGINDKELVAIQAIALNCLLEYQALYGESQAITTNPKLTLAEKQERISEMHYNDRVASVAKDAEAEAEEILTSGQYAALAAWANAYYEQLVANRRIALAVGTSRPTVLLWRKRFTAGGATALLEDAPGRGRPTAISRAKVKKIVEATTQTRPRAATHWSTRTMAKAQGVSHATVQRIWDAHGLQPHRTETFKLSRDRRSALTQPCSVRWASSLIFNGAAESHIVVPSLALPPTIVDRTNLVLSLVLGLAAAGKLGMGYVADRIGGRTALALNFAMTASGLLILRFASQFEMLVAFIVVYGLSWGGPTALLPVVLAESLGLKRFGSLSGLIGISTVLGAASGPIVAGRIFDLSGKYAGAFELFAVALLLGSVAAVCCVPLVTEKSAPIGLSSARVESHRA